ncbi:coiled-coil domain-containing protein 124 [Rhodnius prolixus]|uniref:Putative coiled-coil domain protein n=2 Tax=Rhodnius TaxID=13248 RepID=R4FK63_RHOPR
MPKKFTSVNTKAVAAKARKAEAKELQNSKEKQAFEDAYWQDDDKQVLKKQQRKEEKEKKKQAQLDKKKEAKALLEKEVGAFGIKSITPSKVTVAQIQMAAEKRTKEIKEVAKPKVETHLTKPLEENINRLTIDGLEARTVDEALEILGDDSIDRHPEKRMKAAYLAFEESRLPELKEEFPSLKLSQLKQKIRKEWQKSSENPVNSLN